MHASFHPDSVICSRQYVPVLTSLSILVKQDPTGRLLVLQTSIEKRWLLAVCAVLNAAVSVLYIVMQQENAPLTLHAWNGIILWLGRLTVAAGACEIAAGIWKSASGRNCLLTL